MEQGFVILAIIGACAAGRVPHRSDVASIEVAHPQGITMDRFEAMLQRASQILRSPPQVVEPSQESRSHWHPSQESQTHYHPPQESHSHFQTPQESHRHFQPSQREEHSDASYYLPLFHSERGEKLDMKSKQMQYMVPPSEENQAENFYLIKQKKVPKKFMHAAKHINVKVVENVQREEAPPPFTRGYGKEHNTVFDDVIYGVDAQSAVPEEVPQEHSTDHGFIAPIYSRRLQKSEDMFATSALKRESRLKGSYPVTRFAIVKY